LRIRDPVAGSFGVKEVCHGNPRDNVDLQELRPSEQDRPCSGWSNGL
jgi:hypothetical protein